MESTYKETYDSTFVSEEEYLLKAFDEVKFGRWQITGLVLTVISTYSLPMNWFGATLINGPRDFRCMAPQFSVDSASESDYYEVYINESGTKLNLLCNKSSATANEEFFNNKCITTYVEPLPDNLSVKYDVMENSQIPSCPTILFDQSIFLSTVTSDWALVCDRASLRPLYQMLYVVGAITGSMWGGALADSLGRISTSKLLYILLILSMTGMAFIDNFIIILLLRIVIGFCAHGLILATFTLSMEHIPTKQRTAAGMLLGLPIPFGTMIFGGIGYLVRHWRYLFVYSSIPIILCIPILSYVDESPRWLIQKRRYKEARSIINKAFICNNQVDAKQIYQLSDTEEVDNKFIRQTNKKPTSTDVTWWDGTKKDLVLFLDMKYISCVIPFVWLFQNILYSGLILNAHGFSSDDPFLYLILIGFWEAVSMVIGIPLTNKFGRKPIIMLGYIFSGVLMFLLIVVPRDSVWTFWILVSPAILGVGGAYQVNYVFTQELFPTLIRGKGFSISILFGHIGSIISPVITDLIHGEDWVVPLIFGACGITATLIVVFLPETNALPLCETMDHVRERQQRAFNSNNSEVGNQSNNVETSQSSL